MGCGTRDQEEEDKKETGVWDMMIAENLPGPMKAARAA
jgi:hypothetical protein